MSYIDTLIKNCNLAKEARPLGEIEVTVRKTEASDLASHLSKLDGIQKAVYIIEDLGENPEETFLALSSYKGKKERACAKLNAPSNVMYVGSSTTGVKKRISQHIGHGNKDTYALHLSHWFDGDYKVIVKQYDVTDEVLQIIEDDLSYTLKPAFGKKGGNNK